MFSLILPVILVILGWFILFNSAKHIASRAEAKVLINEVSNLIDETFHENIKVWVKVREDGEFKVSLSLEQNLLKLKKLRIYLNSLNKYGVDALSSKDISRIKKLLTLSPDMETRKDNVSLEKFIVSKIKDTHRIHSEVIDKVHTSFNNCYPPVTTPILHKIKVIKQADLIAIISGALIVITYLFFANLIASH